jgi:hypothetical protein
MKPIAELTQLMARATDPRVLPFAILCGLVLAAVALSFFSLVRAKALVRNAERQTTAGRQECEAILESLRESQNSLATELREIRQQQTPMAVASAPPKPGLNLTKRSQALRMHRRGDRPDRIAASLDIPLQEVDLLLKVHRIVITNI